MSTEHDLDRMVAKVVLRLATDAEYVLLASRFAQACSSVRDVMPSLAQCTDLTVKRRVLLDALAGCQQPIPSEREAARLLSREIAVEIVRGAVGWLDGANAIWRVSIATDEPIPELDTFVYAALEADDNPLRMARFEEGVMAAAKELAEE